MNKEKYREIRHDSGMTQADLAQWLGVAVGTVYRREAGSLEINLEAQRAMELLASITQKFRDSTKPERMRRK